MNAKKTFLTPGLALFTTVVLAQSYSIDWFTIDGGGGTSTGGVYSVSGNSGQPDSASPVDQNGFGALYAGGFWGLLQKGGAPVLKIEKQAGNLVLSWPADATDVVAQSATQLTSGGADWSTFAGTPVRVGDEFELVIGPALTPPNPIRYFRLRSR